MTAKKDMGRYRRRRRALMRLQNGRCYLCGRGFGPKRWAWATADHVTPRAAGGGWGGNVLIAHSRCNHAKGDRAPYPCELLFLAAVNDRLAAA